MKKLAIFIATLFLAMAANASIKVSESANSISGDFTASGEGTFSGVTVTGASVISSTQTALKFEVNASTPLILNTSSATFNTDDLVIEGGQVGIGTTNPDQMLRINDNSDPRLSIQDVNSALEVILTANGTLDAGVVGTTTNDVLAIYTNVTERARFTTDRALQFTTGTSTPSAVTNMAGIFAIDGLGASAEVKVIDEAGNVSLISPHNENGEWVFYSCNQVSGRCINVDLEKFFKEYDAKNGTNYFTESQPLK